MNSERSLRIVFAFALFHLSTRAGEPVSDAEKNKFFEMKVRPLLVERCSKCHGEQKQKASLRLDSRAAMLKGGESGPALVPGKPEQSLLITAIKYTDEDLRMPPKDKLAGEGGKLPPEEIATLTQWVAMGAPWPQGATLAAAKKEKQITDADRAFWSFQPLKSPPLPEVGPASAPAGRDAGPTTNPIDRFILAKLKAENLSPAPEASREALIRRATFDLHGLPPTPEEIAAFASDQSPDAYEKLIERLLASPRYGERWGRHWLDLVRYAESDGFKQDAFRPNAWPYRDYVIKSFNDDKPYDRFVQEQLAGDELAVDDPDVLAGTTFLRLGIYEYNQRDVTKQWGEYLNDITDVSGDVFLGLSMSCARCHDHKFDPILQADYFRLQSFFAGVLPRHDLTLAGAKQKAEYRAALAKWDEKTEKIREQIDAIEKGHLQRASKGAVSKFLPELQAMILKPQPERTPFEHQIAELAGRQLKEEERQLDGKIKGAERDKWAALKRQLAEFDNLKPKPLPEALVATDVGPAAPPTFIPGDKSKRVIEPGFLTVLSGAAGVPSAGVGPASLPAGTEAGPTTAPLKIEPIAGVPTPLGGGGSSGRRSALAKWITRPDNPLATRVMANRIWQYHFGRGLVATSSDFGKLGEKPSHPELLDFLASRFVKEGWSIKKMHRLIMTSATYRQSAFRPAAEVEAARLKDPENRWLWRMNTRRLDAEQIRDAMLAVSGELAQASGGPSVDASAPRRTVYVKAMRNSRDPLLESFDGADGILTTPSRSTTTTATQALLLINGQWPLQRAEAFARRLRGMVGQSSDKTELVRAAYRLAFGRSPDAAEQAAALAYLGREGGGDSQPRQLADAPGTASAPSTFLQPQTQVMPHRGGQAVLFRNGSADDLLKLPKDAPLPAGDFTLEAVVLLDSLYENASVRTIASQWDGNQKNAGWALGITSEKSKHEPLNLILQLTGKEGYEVIASDLRLELHKTYYVAASVRIADTSRAGVTFYMRDLSDPDAPLRSANVAHRVTGGYQGQGEAAFAIGGRPGHTWDGLIDEVRYASSPLAKEQLLLNDPDYKATVVGNWRFEQEPGTFKDSAGSLPDLTRSAPSAPKTADKPADTRLVDFCHVLLNANEFLYVE